MHDKSEFNCLCGVVSCLFMWCFSLNVSSLIIVGIVHVMFYSKHFLWCPFEIVPVVFRSLSSCGVPFSFIVVASWTGFASTCVCYLTCVRLKLLKSFEMTLCGCRG